MHGSIAERTGHCLAGGSTYPSRTAANVPLAVAALEDKDRPTGDDPHC